MGRSVQPAAVLALAALVKAQVVPPVVTTGDLEILEEMARIIEPCVQPTTTSRVFTRCVDTHSSIHAHWAAYRLALHHGSVVRPALASYLALQPAKLQAETTYMRYPYAAAWFLRLAVDYEKCATRYGAPDRSRLRAVGDQMAAWLKGYYDTRPIDPYAVEYANPAWALAQLHAYYDFTGNRTLADLVGATIRRVFLVRITGSSFAADLGSRGFFSVFGNWIHAVARTQSAADFARFWALQAPIPDAHLLVNPISSIHSYGLGWSRMWALRTLAELAPTAAERQRFGDAAERHKDAGMDRHRVLKGNFFAYDHWVPQFAVYAVTESR